MIKENIHKGYKYRIDDEAQELGTTGVYINLPRDSYFFDKLPSYIKEKTDFSGDLYAQVINNSEEQRYYLVVSFQSDNASLEELDAQAKALIDEIIKLEYRLPIEDKVRNIWQEWKNSEDYQKEVLEYYNIEEEDIVLASILFSNGNPFFAFRYFKNTDIIEKSTIITDEVIAEFINEKTSFIYNIESDKFHWNENNN